MMLALDPASISGADRRELSQRALKPGEEEEFTRLQNHIFDGAWGFCPNTTAEIVLLLNTRGYGYAGVILSHKGEKIVGYCWTAKLYSSDRKRNAVTGRIHMMGVTPESRRQGVGTYILRGGLNHLASAGIHSVELTTDNENRAACSLYRKAGFKPKAALVWYEKKLR
jgi:ribosomal protein S18 acetylase RimI-like enzyme